MMLNNNADLKGKDEDLWFETYKFQFEDYQHTIDLMKLIHLIPSNSACCERGRWIFFHSHYFRS